MKSSYKKLHFLVTVESVVNKYYYDKTIFAIFYFNKNYYLVQM